MSPRAAARLTRWWTRLYTAGVPGDLREARRAEVESDLWESVADGAPSRHILARLALGLADDLTWSLTVMDTSTRATTTWSFGTLLVIAFSWLWLSFAPESATMRETAWAFPAALTLHLVGMVLFIGMRLVLGLRLTGWAFAGTSPSQLMTRVGPWSLVGAIVTAVSGLALYTADSARMAANPMFELKIAALSAALVNAWILHTVLAGRIHDRDTSEALPISVQASAYLSLILWVAIMAAGRLVAFV